MNFVLINRMDHYEDANRQCERLTEKSSKQDEHITKLNNRYKHSFDALCM